MRKSELRDQCTKIGIHALKSELRAHSEKKIRVISLFLE